jgi:hypothetical protein
MMSAGCAGTRLSWICARITAAIMPSIAIVIAALAPAMFSLLTVQPPPFLPLHIVFLILLICVFFF